MASKKSAYQGKPNKRIIVNVPKLNVRKGAGLDYDVMKVIRKDEEYTITQIQGEWGRLSSGGWIMMKYVIIE